jgi:hypothetical protein
MEKPMGERVSGSALVRAHAIQYVRQPQHPGLTWRETAERVARRRRALWWLTALTALAAAGVWGAG